MPTSTPALAAATSRPRSPPRSCARTHAGRCRAGRGIDLYKLTSQPDQLNGVAEPDGAAAASAGAGRRLCGHAPGQHRRRSAASECLTSSHARPPAHQGAQAAGAARLSLLPRRNARRRRPAVRRVPRAEGRASRRQGLPNVFDDAGSVAFLRAACHEGSAEASPSSSCLRLKATTRSSRSSAASTTASACRACSTPTRSAKHSRWSPG